ncbi:MAG: hypothetical protein IT288_03450 [Bdellovibrionales bacterium]|nr:hypothetical protein [Bdellovibrionales bacterium]
MKREDEKGNWHPSWWIDYMEGELEWPVKKGMEWMFRHNATQREILKNFIKLRRMVRKSDPLADLPQDEDFYQRLHDKIMAGIKTVDRAAEETTENTSNEVVGLR